MIVWSEGRPYACALFIAEAHQWLGQVRPCAHCTPVPTSGWTIAVAAGPPTDTTTTATHHEKE